MRLTLLTLLALAAGPLSLDAGGLMAEEQGRPAPQTRTAPTGRPAPMGRPGKPAPPESRYAYTFEVDAKSLPEGVSVRTVGKGPTARHFLTNAGDKPFVINAIKQGDRLVSGTKLVGGKVYQYFPNGVPMAGKQHLKGWQSPFGEITETILRFPRPPETIYEGRKAGLGRDLPPNESHEIPAEYDGESHPIKVTVRYELNPEYDANR